MVQIHQDQHYMSFPMSGATIKMLAHSSTNCLTAAQNASYLPNRTQRERGGGGGGRRGDMTTASLQLPTKPLYADHAFTGNSANGS